MGLQKTWTQSEVDPKVEPSAKGLPRKLLVSNPDGASGEKEKLVLTRICKVILPGSDIKPSARILDNLNHWGP